ncbi:glycosyltransferase family 2 protein [Chengkuizengella axinellae]|uniref:Glycosyltransferase family 2 protein n=1 Tax=Chengkuizengella axinellae TaxID=3064388 RepID=A0ABT9J153_9BACL|nr:glycosyltransferase family 2 protein [Chengkuizengella sp. 2205SS18-9]MDP5275344.1 glycosyltransferase family 2 protein [Chengkuizengella sp. 2205SS18-9]
MKKHVVVFIPAYNEEKTIGEVISRIPRDANPQVFIEVLVINDGSLDHTVAVAKKAGADAVHSFERNKGLGAAVRQGLVEGYKRGADIAVMIDADCEYPPEQIPELIQPIIQNQADYVMGSRFLGKMKGMRLHRRLGNYVFTFIQTLLLRKWIYDGQSGMRAFSREVMEHAEIIHDYNYAQVLTLNIVRKGFRMKEIPIHYQVRTQGQSFITFKAYIPKVCKAIVKEMLRPVNKVGLPQNKSEKVRNETKFKSSSQL